MSWFIVILAFLLASIKTTSKDITPNSVAVVIPAFNEDRTVAHTVKIVKSIDKISDVVVVNDGSTDNTESEALSAGARVINHTTNLGKGSALQTGFKNTNSDIVAFIDADISNLSKDKVNAIIDPLIEGKYDITKTKFARESGRVTELTAKPLLKFFFPEVTFDQPLSGQFAGKRSALNNIRFEDDYGVDVGIVLDADVHGISIGEIDIGDVKHEMSSLSDLHVMANEVVRTIISRAVDYGRVTMMDTLGEYIRWAIMGLSLIILGLFMLFFVPGIHLSISLVVAFIGFVVTIYYVYKLLRRSIAIFKKGSRVSAFKSFIKMHFPFLVCGLILILMLTTFMSAATFTDGAISIEPTSRNLIIVPQTGTQAIAVRGPYTIDSAIENETDIVRFPSDAMVTMHLSQGDLLKEGDSYYSINATRENEDNTFRIPVEARKFLEVNTGDVISNSRLSDLFDSTMFIHYSNSSNLTNYTIANSFIVYAHESNQTSVNISVNGSYIRTFVGSFEPDSSYAISINGHIVQRFKGSEVLNGEVLEFYNGDDLYTVNFTSIENQTTSRQFINSNTGSFLEFNLDL